jgi:hypothetical protein
MNKNKRIANKLKENSERMLKYKKKMLIYFILERHIFSRNHLKHKNRSFIEKELTLKILEKITKAN